MGPPVKFTKYIFPYVYQDLVFMWVQFVHDGVGFFFNIKAHSDCFGYNRVIVSFESFPRLCFSLCLSVIVLTPRC